MRINIVNYEKRKKQYAARIETMIGFVKENVQCRSRVIAAYFGDDSIEALQGLR